MRASVVSSRFSNLLISGIKTYYAKENFKRRKSHRGYPNRGRSLLNIRDQKMMKMPKNCLRKLKFRTCIL